MDITSELVKSLGLPTALILGFAVFLWRVGWPFFVNQVDIVQRGLSRDREKLLELVEKQAVAAEKSAIALDLLQENIKLLNDSVGVIDRKLDFVINIRSLDRDTIIRLNGGSRKKGDDDDDENSGGSKRSTH